jgi:hypothetical protein
MRPIERMPSSSPYGGTNTALLPNQNFVPGSEPMPSITISMIYKQEKVGTVGTLNSHDVSGPADLSSPLVGLSQISNLESLTNRLLRSGHIPLRCTRYTHHPLPFVMLC